jgi:nitrogen fixation/metabolism regulation signal transduction histidine kinase
LSFYVAAFFIALSASVVAIAWGSTSRARRDAERRAARAQESGRLLQAIFEGAPSAVLMTETGIVVMANTRACEMFAEGKTFQGQNFLSLLGNAPAAFREAMLANEDALFTVGDGAGDSETFHLTKSDVSLEGAPHVLLVVEKVTREIRRQEVEVWKTLLRTISHELNNSLAPISSMVHSAKLILDNPEHLPKLARVFDTIEDRTRHLQEFIEGYVRFARLPKPRLTTVKWTELLGRLQELNPALKIVCGTDVGLADAAQMEQVLINLVKNAVEAGSPPGDVSLSVTARDEGGCEVVVDDRGAGMGKDVLASALLPFYSTKDRGTGLGLALCREIVEAHGGKIRLQNRDGGGLSVSCSLPGRDARESDATTVRLTMTRA